MLHILSQLHLVAVLRDCCLWMAVDEQMAQLLDLCCTGQLDGGPGTALEVAAILGALLPPPLHLNLTPLTAPRRVCCGLHGTGVAWRGEGGRGWITGVCSKHSVANGKLSAHLHLRSACRTCANVPTHTHSLPQAARRALRPQQHSPQYTALHAQRSSSSNKLQESSSSSSRNNSSRGQRHARCPPLPPGGSWRCG